jgi:hypothetical protein
LFAFFGEFVVLIEPVLVKDGKGRSTPAATELPLASTVDETGRYVEPAVRAGDAGCGDGALREDAT